MRRPSPPVLDGLPLSSRLRIFTALCVVLGLTFGVKHVTAVDNAWVHKDDIVGLVDSDDAESYAAPLEYCGAKAEVPGGFAPAWIRVGGSTDPHTPIVEVTGQVLDPHAYVTFAADDDLPANTKTNAFVNYTDAPFNHYARDLNMFLTLDPEHRHRLSTGSFGEGDSNERGNLEIEWERGGIPMYAFPALGDRLHVWGTHVFDCGHGDSWEIGRDDDDNYRTEMHAPYGWVVFRQTADADGVPDGGKQNNSPWQWYGATDLKGMAVALPTSGLLFTPVRATVADVYFSSFGGNVVEAVNGCDDADNVGVNCYDYADRPELNGNSDIESWQWHNPILDYDYSFVVPAPPVPAGAPGNTQMIFELEDRCGDVPVDPTIPNKHDHKEALEEVEGIGATAYAKDWPIGAARCNHAPTNQAPYIVQVDRSTTAPFASWNNTNRPAILVTVRAKTGYDGIDGNDDDPTYPANDYISFAYRVKVAWDYAPPAAQRARAFRADFDTLHVYNDGDACNDDLNIDPDDGEWVMTLRVNDTTIHPVEGTAPDDIDADDLTEPFWEEGAINDERCGGNEGQPRNYEMGAKGAQFLTLFFTALAGANIEVWDRTYDKDHGTDDDLAPVFRVFYPQPPAGGSESHTIGTTDANVDLAHTIDFTFTDVSNPIPANGPLSIGAPMYGPNGDTSGLKRVTGATPITLSPPAGVTTFQWRVYEVTFPASEPGAWQYDFDDSDGLTVDLPDTGSGTYTIEWAAILGAGVAATVSERSRVDVEVDNTPPTLTVPADFAVYANSAAGANVAYESTAIDDLPGPVTVTCLPASGTVFPNGANAPLATTVDCTATDAVDNSSSDSFNVTVTSPHGYIND